MQPSPPDLFLGVLVAVGLVRRWRYVLVVAVVLMSAQVFLGMQTAGGALFEPDAAPVPWEHGAGLTAASVGVVLMLILPAVSRHLGRPRVGPAGFDAGAVLLLLGSVVVCRGAFSGAFSGDPGRLVTGAAWIVLALSASVLLFRGSRWSYTAVTVWATVECVRLVPAFAREATATPEHPVSTRLVLLVMTAWMVGVFVYAEYVRRRVSVLNPAPAPA